MKMSRFSGEQLAQVDNPDPFAPPVWRSPVYHTPGWVITVVQLVRLIVAVVRFLARHPLLDLAAAVLGLSWSLAGWPGPVILTVTVAAGLDLLAVARASVVLSVHRPAGAGQVAPLALTSGTGWPC